MSEVIRFGIVGTLATLIQVAVYYLLAAVVSHNVALPVSYALSLCFNYVMTTQFTFRVKSSGKRGMGFAASHTLNFTLQLLLLNLFVWMGMDRQLAIIPVLAVCIPVNFVLVRRAMK